MGRFWSSFKFRDPTERGQEISCSLKAKKKYYLIIIVHRMRLHGVRDFLADGKENKGSKGMVCEPLNNIAQKKKIKI